jgi:hypothetical protein
VEHVGHPDPASSDSDAIVASTAPSEVRGTTPSCTMKDGLIRPTAAKADLRPAQMTARSAGSSAALISVAPAASQIARTVGQLGLDLGGRAVQLDDQHRGGAAG